MPSQPLMATYDPKMVVITFGGTPIMGYAEDSFVECALPVRSAQTVR